MPELTTLNEVRAYLQKPVTDTSQDALISSLIRRVSQQIETYAQREFTPADGQTRTFAYYGGGYLNVAPFDLRTVTGVTYDTENAAPVVLDGDEYRLRPFASATGTYQQVYLPGYSAGLLEPVGVEITGDWGFASIPEDVSHAAVMAVAHALRNEVGITSTITELGEVRFERPAALPATVRAILDSYRQPVAA